MKFSKAGFEHLSEQTFAQKFKGDLQQATKVYAEKLSSQLKTKVSQSDFDELVELAVKEGGHDKSAVKTRVEELNDSEAVEGAGKEAAEEQKPVERREVVLFKEGQLLVRKLRAPIPKDSKLLDKYFKNRRADLARSEELREIFGAMDLRGPAAELVKSLVNILEAAEKDGDRLLQEGEDRVEEQRELEDDVEMVIATRLRAKVPPEAEKAVRDLLLKNGASDKNGLTAIGLLQERKWEAAGKILKIRLADPPPTEKQKAELEKQLRGQLKVDPGDAAIAALLAIALERGPKAPAIKQIVDLLHEGDWKAAGKLLKVDLGESPSDKAEAEAEAKKESARVQFEKETVSEAEEQCAELDKMLKRLLPIQDPDRKISGLNSYLDDSGKTMASLAKAAKQVDEGNRKILEGLKKQLAENRKKAEAALKDTVAAEEESEEADRVVRREIKVKLPRSVEDAVRDYLLKKDPKSKAATQMVALINAGELEAAGKELGIKLKDRHSPLEVKAQKALERLGVSGLIDRAEKVSTALEKVSAPSDPKGWATLASALPEALKEAAEVQRDVEEAVTEIQNLEDAQHQRTKKLAGSGKRGSHSEDLGALEDAQRHLGQAESDAKKLLKEAEAKVAEQEGATRKLDGYLKKSTLPQKVRKSMMDRVQFFGATSTEVRKALELMAGGYVTAATKLLGVST